MSSSTYADGRRDALASYVYAGDAPREPMPEPVNPSRSYWAGYSSTMRELSFFDECADNANPD